MPIYVRLFNLILCSGFVPKEWLIEMIKPLYKNKGDKHNADNYRGITLLSCLGKLFTSVLNERLTDFLNDKGTIGSEQAGFRKSYSTIDHTFTLKCLIDFYLQRRKKLYCTFVDYRKAFDSIDRVNMWIKLLANDINGKLFKVVYNLYKGAKSCVTVNGTSSALFNCLIGMR